MKTIVYRLKITDIGHRLCHECSLFFDPIKTPACELYLDCYAKSFAARTLVNSASKIFEGDVKNKSEQQLYGRKRRVFKFCEKENQNRDDALR